MSKKELLDKLAKAIIDDDEIVVGMVAEEIVKAGIDPVEAILEGATKGLETIGERFQRCEAFLPDLVRAGDSMVACVEVFKKHFRAEKMSQVILGKMVIGTVFGDIHDIGKNLVATMGIASGFEVYDLGINVPVKEFIRKAEEVKARVIALSSLLTHTANYQRLVIEHLKDAGLRHRYYVVVGGAPISPEWAEDIGADGYSRTAVGAIEVLKRLVTEKVPPPLPQTIVVPR